MAKSLKMSNRFKAKFNIKKGDTVIVISGNSKPQKDDHGKFILQVVEHLRLAAWVRIRKG